MTTMRDWIDEAPRRRNALAAYVEEELIRRSSVTVYGEYAVNAFPRLVERSFDPGADWNALRAWALQYGWKTEPEPETEHLEFRPVRFSRRR